MYGKDKYEMNFLKLANKAVQLGTAAQKHLGTADKFLTLAQQQADKHLAGTDLHKQLTSKLAMAQGHVTTAKSATSSIQKAAASVKAGGKKKRKSRKTSRRKTKKTKRKTKRKTKKTSRRGRKMH